MLVHLEQEQRVKLVQLHQMRVDHQYAFNYIFLYHYFSYSLASIEILTVLRRKSIYFLNTRFRITLFP